MHRYHAKEQEKYRKETQKGGSLFFMIGLGIIVSFIPVALISVGSMRAYKKIKGVFKNE